MKITLDTELKAEHVVGSYWALPGGTIVDMSVVSKFAPVHTPEFEMDCAWVFKISSLFGEVHRVALELDHSEVPESAKGEAFIGYLGDIQKKVEAFRLDLVNLAHKEGK